MTSSNINLPQHLLRGLSSSTHPHMDKHHDVSQTQRLFLNSTATLLQQSSIGGGGGNDDAGDSPWPWIGVVVVFLFLCWCTRPNIPDSRFRKSRGYWMEDRNGRIHRSLNVRQVVSADEAGNLQLGEIEEEDENNELEDGNHSQISNMEDDNHIACCSICLEPYRVGDRVAWTARPPESDEQAECRHVFHYECIVPWLQNVAHDDCPDCRFKILVDVFPRQRHPPQHQDDEQQQDDDDDHGSRSSVNSTVFVIMHGLIARARRASYNLIGKTVFSVDNSSSGSAADAPLTSLSEPSPLRKARSYGEGLLFKRQSLLRRRMRSLSVSESSKYDGGEDDGIMLRSSTKLEFLPGPMDLRRVASAGPSTPLRRTSSSSGTGRQEMFVRQQFSEDDNGIGVQVHRTTTATSGFFLEHPEVSESESAGSTDLLLGRTLSSSGMTSMRQRSALRTSIREECEQPLADINQVDSGEDGLRKMLGMRYSVSWAQDVQDDTDHNDEDDILIRTAQTHPVV